MLKGSSIFPLNEPIHIPSVFEELILRPEIFWKLSISLKSDFTESTSANVAVVSWSSAYCRTFVTFNIYCIAPVVVLPLRQVWSCWLPLFRLVQSLTCMSEGVTHFLLSAYPFICIFFPWSFWNSSKLCSWGVTPLGSQVWNLQPGQDTSDLAEQF